VDGASGWSKLRNGEYFGAIHFYCVGDCFLIDKPQREKMVQTLLRASIATLLVLALTLGCQRSAQDDTLTLRMGHVYEVNSPTHRYATGRLAERLQEKPIGLAINVYPGGQLGSEAELLEQLVAGEIDLSIAGPSFLAMWHPPLGAFDAAYAFRDIDHMLTVADGPLIAPHWEVLRERFGVRVLATWPYGVRHLTANRPVRTPADLQGFRLRMPGARVWQESGAALGASPMPMSFSEVYMALQQGIADGQENPVPVIESMKFHEVQKYLILTGHIQSSVQVLIREPVWQRLTDDQRGALTTIVKELGKDLAAGLEEEEKTLLERWEHDKTMQIIRDADIEAFRTRAQQHFRSGYPFSEIYQKITAERSP